MDIVLDTSVLIAKYPLQGLSVRYLAAFADHEGTAVVVPEVVVKEMSRWIEEETAKVLNSVRRDVGKARQLGIADSVLSLDEGSAQAAATDAVGRFLVMLDQLDARIAPIPEAIGHRQVIDRLHSRQKPFKSSGSGEDGYRDYLIWETLLSLSPGDDQGGASESHRVAFLTANTRDFAGADDQLDDTLRDEAATHGLSVELYTSVDDFLARVVEPSLPTSTKVTSLIQSNELETSFAAFIEEQFDQLTPYAIARGNQILPDEMEDVTVEDLYDVAVEAIEDVRDLRSGATSVLLTADAKARVEFFVSKSDAYLMDEAWANGLADANERYFSGEIEVDVKGMLRVEVELQGEELEFKAIELIDLYSD